jgi:hypothetical protein
MARPGPEIILSVPTEDGGSLEVMNSQGVWVLAYRGIPCALRERYWAADGEHVKYPRTGYNNRAHCERLAEKLNDQFNTDQFSCLEVVKHIAGKTMIRRLTSE